MASADEGDRRTAGVKLTPVPVRPLQQYCIQNGFLLLYKDHWKNFVLTPKCVNVNCPFIFVP